MSDHSSLGMSGSLSGAVEEVKRRTSLTSLIGEYVTLKKAGHSWKGLCPFHGEKTPSFHVHEDRGFFHCFGCGASGDAISFLRQHVGYSFMEALRLLAERAGVELPEREEASGAPRRPMKDGRETRDRQYALNREALGWFRGRLGGPALEYLAGRRGLSRETIDAFQLGYAPDAWDALSAALGTDPQKLRDAESLGLVAPRDRGGVYDRFRHRVIFPVFALGGEIIGFGGRTLSSDPETPKYINSSESEIFKKGATLYGLFQARKAIRTKGRALVVEGNVDVLTLVQHGFAETVAPMGTALTEDQAFLLRRFAPEVVLVYDGDGAGRAAAFKAVPLMLKAGAAGRVVSLPAGEDPDTFVRRHGAEALEALIATAPPLFDHVLEHALAAYDGTIPSASAAVAEIAPVFALLTNPLEQEQYRRRVAQRFGIDERQMGRWLRRGVPDEAPRAVEGISSAPRMEREVLELLLRHPEWFPYWHSQEGASTVTNEGVRDVLDGAWELCQTTGRLEMPELFAWLKERGRQAEADEAMKLVLGDDYRGDKAEQAFMENVAALAARARKIGRRARDVRSIGR